MTSAEHRTGELAIPSHSVAVGKPRGVTRPRRKAIFIVGVSRSGTSLVSHLIHTLGAAVPDDLLDAGYGNPMGHWEPRALVALNDQILAAMGTSWRDPRPTNQAWFSSRPAYEFLLRVTRQVQADYAEHSLIVIKDPRLTRLLPLYLAALDMLDIEPHVILQLRHPSEVMASLMARDELAPGLSELLWLRGLTEAEFVSRDCRRTWLSLDNITDDWQGALARIGHDLGIDWPNPPEDVAATVDGFFKRRFLHQGASRHSLTMSTIATQAWDAAEQGIRGYDALARLRFDDIRSTLADIDLLSAALTTRARGKGLARIALRSDLVQGLAKWLLSVSRPPKAKIAPRISAG